MRTLSAPDNDIDFAIVSELEALRQRIQQRLRFFRGEWFLNATEGVPYLSDLLGDRPDLGLVEAVIHAQIRAVEGVKSVTDITVEREERQFVIGAVVQTIYGGMNLASTVPDTTVQALSNLTPATTASTINETELIAALEGVPITWRDEEMTWRDEALTWR